MIGGLCQLHLISQSVFEMCTVVHRSTVLLGMQFVFNQLPSLLMESGLCQDQVMRLCASGMHTLVLS